MTKETKAERMARVEAEELVRQEELKSTYPQRLMAALHEAQTEGFLLDVKGMSFVLYDQNDSDTVAIVSYEFTNAAEGLLEDLLHAVNWKKQRRLESNRRFEVKQNALSKLTPEEKELLGL